MSRIVQKYGGTSVATPARIGRVAIRVKRARQDGDGVVVVVSAMGSTTDRLVNLASRVNPDPPAREMDMLLSTGEMVTAPLLAMALARIGVPAISLTGPQAGIRTSGAHGRARIIDIVPQRIAEALDRQQVAIVAGFQGSTGESDFSTDVTTLGRGGSDTTAVALAVALRARQCEIYTDVSAVHTADPRLVHQAQPLAEIGYAEMLEFAAAGARVLHPRAVEIGETYSMPVWVRASFSDEPGTLIRDGSVEQPRKVRGIAHEIDVAKVTLRQVPDQPGIAATIFGALGDAQINVDMIVQTVSQDGTTDLSFTIADTDLNEARRALDHAATAVGATGFEASRGVAKVSVVGSGLRSAPGASATMFRALAQEGINIQMIITSEIRITCVIAVDRVEDAVRALHRAYALDVL